MGEPLKAVSTKRRAPGTRWSAMRINWRWLVQALALIGGIYCFKRAFDTGKVLTVNFSTNGAFIIGVYFLLFVFCFFILMFTSYLKERGGNTLKNRITVFEKLVVRLRLENYSENGDKNR